MSVPLGSASIIIRKPRGEWIIQSHLLDRFADLRDATHVGPHIRMDRDLICLTTHRDIRHARNMAVALQKQCGIYAQEDYELHSAAHGPIFEAPWLEYFAKDGILHCRYRSVSSSITGRA